jgi:hypothetical protein
MQIFECAIEEIVTDHPNLYLEHCNEFVLRVSWSEITAFKAQRMWQTEQPKSIVERAAIALAALLIAHLVPGGQMRVTREAATTDPLVLSSTEVKNDERS